MLDTLETNETHQKLAELSETAHKKAAKYLLEQSFGEDNPPEMDTILRKELAATRLGKLRLDIKKHLASEVEEIDRLVKRVVG
jgi:hypothetical protein